MQPNIPLLQIKQKRLGKGLDRICISNSHSSHRPGLKSRSLAPFQPLFLTPSSNACPILPQRHCSANTHHEMETYFESKLKRYAEYIMRNAGLNEAQVGIKITGRNINNLRYAYDTTLITESE